MENKDKDNQRLTKNESYERCACCGHYKMCHLYSLWIGSCWVCTECRRPKADKF